MVNGSVAPGFERVVRAFESNVGERAEGGAAFAAYHDGALVVDLWAGCADAQRGVPWREDTLVGVFSGTKGLVATCLLLLIERGELDLDAPVKCYWPEFGACGKTAIQVRDLVCHRSGLPGLLTPVSVDEATDDVRMAQLLAHQRPIAQRAGELIYHAMTFGWLCGELIRRVDGRSVGRFLRDEVAAPLGLDAWIGLPEEFEERVALIERGIAFGLGSQASQGGIPVSREVDERGWSIWSNPPRFFGGELATNSPRWRAAEIPATNGIVTARSLARLYGCLACGGEIDGTRLLSPDTIEQGRRSLASGHEPYLNAPIAFGVGFQLQTSNMGLGPAGDAFGHNGAGGSTHGAWPSLRTGFSYAPARLGGLAGVDPRAQVLLEALHSAVKEREPTRRAVAS